MMAKARDRDLLVEECNKELLVYDLKTDRAHSLNNAAALIWRWCDGNTTVEDMTSRLSAELQQQVDQSEVVHALQRLGEANLLDRAPVGGVSRRQFVRKVGAAVAGLAIVASIRTPAAASHRSGHANNGVGNGPDSDPPGLVDKPPQGNDDFGDPTESGNQPPSPGDPSNKFDHSK